MEATPLRSVPARVPGTVNPVRALAEVEALLPDLRPAAQRALALVDLGRRPRGDVATELAVPEPELARLLAEARKRLRRTLAALPSGGWCERAEGLISDRLDGHISARGRARLDAHMAACERCDAHERQLARAHDLLVESYLASGAHAPAPRAVSAPPAELRVVAAQPDTPAVRPAPAVALRAALAIAVLLVIAIVVLAAIGVLHVP